MVSDVSVRLFKVANPGRKPVKVNEIGNYVDPGCSIVVQDGDPVLIKALSKGALIVVEEISEENSSEVPEPASAPETILVSETESASAEESVEEESVKETEIQPTDIGENRKSTKKKTSAWSEES